MQKALIVDTKHLARILYDHRDKPDYLTKSGQQRILDANGHKLARGTFENHYEAIRSEIDKLHDASFRKETRPAERERMAELFSQMDYITGLKNIWDGEPDTSGKYPSFRDKLQAGKQAAEFFGWNAPINQNVNIKSEWLDWIKSGNVIEFTKQPPPPNLKIRPIE